jgi:hypothetical protein
MMEEREQQAKEIVEGIEKEWAGVGEKAEKRETALKNDRRWKGNEGLARKLRRGFINWRWFWTIWGAENSLRRPVEAFL